MVIKNVAKITGKSAAFMAGIQGFIWFIFCLVILWYYYFYGIMKVVFDDQKLFLQLLLKHFYEVYITGVKKEQSHFIISRNLFVTIIHVYCILHFIWLIFSVRLYYFSDKNIYVMSTHVTWIILSYIILISDTLVSLLISYDFHYCKEIPNLEEQTNCYVIKGSMLIVATRGIILLIINIQNTYIVRLVLTKEINFTDYNNLMTYLNKIPRPSCIPDNLPSSFKTLPRSHSFKY